MRRYRGLVVLAAVVTAMCALAAAAHAAYPGANGKIAYVAPDGGISTIDPDGTNVVQLGVAGASPVWSPDGTKISFIAGGELRLMNPDGTGQTPVTGPPLPGASIEMQTWSPDGLRIAFAAYSGSQYDLWIVDVDGTDLVQLTDTPADELRPSWSPDGTRIAFDDWTTIHSIRPDGSGRRTIVPEPVEEWEPLNYGPDWSPSGARIVYGAIYYCDGDSIGVLGIARGDGSAGGVLYGNTCEQGGYHLPSWAPDGTRVVTGDYLFTIAANGSDRVSLGPYGYQPDWQPLPANTDLGAAPRPLGATPFRVALVPAAKPCTAPNREHGPPLAYGSCAPVQPESPNLTVSQGDARLRSVGSVRMEVVAGVPGPPDDSDIGIRFSLTNVMHGSDFSDYTGELLASVNVRRTDREPGPVSSTTQDFPFTLPVPCASTADTFLGSTCAVNTTATAIVPSVVKDGDRTMWAFDALRVFDGGPDGDAQTQGDNSLFATQGVFVP